MRRRRVPRGRHGRRRAARRRALDRSWSGAAAISSSMSSSRCARRWCSCMAGVAADRPALLWPRPTSHRARGVRFLSRRAARSRCRDPRVRGDAPGGVLLVGFFAVITFGLVGQGRVHPVAVTPLAESSGAIRRRLVRRCRARRLHVGPHVPAAAQHRVLSGDADADAARWRPLFGMHDGTASRDRRMLRALWAGVVISLAAFLWALVYVVRLAEDLVGPERAADAALLLAAYPFAVFFSAPYTESLFLLAAVGAFFHFRRGSGWPRPCWGLARRPDAAERLLPERAARYSGARSRCIVTESPGPSEGQGRVEGTKGQWTVRSASRLLDGRAMPGIGMLRLHGLPVRADRRVVRVGAQSRSLGPDVSGMATVRHRVRLAARRTVPAGGHEHSVQHAQRARRAVRASRSRIRCSGGSAPPWASSCSINLVPPLFAGGVLSMGRLSSTLFPLFLALAAVVPPRSVPAWVAGFGIGQGLCADALLHVARAVLTESVLSR